jgi:hypothetical protein
MKNNDINLKQGEDFQEDQLPEDFDFTIVITIIIDDNENELNNFFDQNFNLQENNYGK